MIGNLIGLMRRSCSSVVDAIITPTYAAMESNAKKKVRVVHVCDECGAEHALPRKAWPGCVAPGWTKTDRGMLCPDHSP